MINIREAAYNDLQPLLDLYSVIYEDTDADEKPEIKTLWNRILTDRFYHVIVADLDGEIVSTCTCIIIQNLTYEQRPLAIIENLVTASSHRSQGLATACIEEAKRIAKSENCFKITLNTNAKLESTKKFYEKLGFDRKEFTAFVQFL